MTEAPLKPVVLEEPCRRCGAMVYGALDGKGVGVYIDVGEPVIFGEVMPYAGPWQKRHHCKPKENNGNP